MIAPLAPAFPPQHQPLTPAQPNLLPPPPAVPGAERIEHIVVIYMENHSFALGSPDEGVRTVAGMFLVQAGKRAEPLIEEAIRRCQHLPIVLIIARGRRGPPLGTGVAALQRGRRFRGG